MFDIVAGHVEHCRLGLLLQTLLSCGDHRKEGQIARRARSGRDLGGSRQSVGAGRIGCYVFGVVPLLVRQGLEVGTVPNML